MADQQVRPDPHPGRNILPEMKKRSHYCCVPHCRSDARTVEGQKKTYHRFPTNLTTRKAWIVNIRRDEGALFKVTSNTVVCSDHFCRDDFKWTPVRKTLRPTATPTIFAWKAEPSHRSGKATNRHMMRSVPKKRAEVSLLQDETPAGEYEEAMDTTDADAVVELNRQLAEKDQHIKDIIKEKDNMIKSLQDQLKIEHFGVNRFGTDDNLFNFYTGFSTVSASTALFEFVQPTASTMTSHYYEPSDTFTLAGRQRCMLLIDELFMFLCRLRINCLEQDLAVRFNCSVATVSRKLLTWVNYLYFLLGSIPIWLPQSQIQQLMPDVFKAKYNNTRVVIDCTEIRSQHPSSLVLNTQLFSYYKNYTTYKGLIGIAPHGAVTFVSSLYTGCMSDKEITKLCGLMDLLEPGDSVMADKGFLVHDLLKENQCSLNIPPFLKDRGQFSVADITQTEEIASLRIHVERFIRRVKENHMFDSEIPLNIMGSINQWWTVAVILANFIGPLIK